MEANRYSFHPIIKAYIKTVIIAGIERGMIIFTIVPILVLPSIKAASSIDSGIVLK